MWLGENALLGMADKGLEAVVETRDALALLELSIELESSTTDGDQSTKVCDISRKSTQNIVLLLNP